MTDFKKNPVDKYDCDYLYEDLGSLVNDEYRAWYISCFYKLGKDRVLQLASQAKADGKNPNRLFSYLLKKECREPRTGLSG